MEYNVRNAINLEDLSNRVCFLDSFALDDLFEVLYKHVGGGGGQGLTKNSYITGDSVDDGMLPG